MAKVVMTLLVPRKEKKDARYPYAAQMVWQTLAPPSNIEITKVSVRLIDEKGNLAGRSEVAKYYHAENWRAATLAEQGETGLLIKQLPSPWYPLEDDAATFGLIKSVFDHPDSGDRDTNNGQHWTIDDNLTDQWKAEWEKRRQFDKERGERTKAQREWEKAETDRRIAEWGEY